MNGTLTLAIPQLEGVVWIYSSGPGPLDAIGTLTPAPTQPLEDICTYSGGQERTGAIGTLPTEELINALL